MPMTQKEKYRRYYLKKLALQGKEPKYKRDMVLDEYVRLSNSLKPVIGGTTSPQTPSLIVDEVHKGQSPLVDGVHKGQSPLNILEDKIKSLEEKLKNASANPIVVPSAPSVLPEYEELKSLNREISEVKKIFSNINYDPTDYEKQLINVYDTKYLYNSKRADLNDLETLNYIIGIKKILLQSLMKLKSKFKL